LGGEQGRSLTALQLHPFIALLIIAFGFGILSGMSLLDIVKSVNDGFGGTIGYMASSFCRIVHRHLLRKIRGVVMQA
jgi:predicted histidine transporter YuiF (NhaC family)